MSGLIDSSNGLAFADETGLQFENQIGTATLMIQIVPSGKVTVAASDGELVIASDGEFVITAS